MKCQYCNKEHDPRIACPEYIKQSVIDHKKVKKFKCYFGFHEWTCAAEEGIKPTQKQLDDGIPGFHDYAKAYCKYCRKLL